MGKNITAAAIVGCAILGVSCGKFRFQAQGSAKKGSENSAAAEPAPQLVVPTDLKVSENTTNQLTISGRILLGSNPCEANGQDGKFEIFPEISTDGLSVRAFRLRSTVLPPDTLCPAVYSPVYSDKSIEVALNHNHRQDIMFDFHSLNLASKIVYDWRLHDLAGLSFMFTSDSLEENDCGKYMKVRFSVDSINHFADIEFISKNPECDTGSNQRKVLLAKPKPNGSCTESHWNGKLYPSDEDTSPEDRNVVEIIEKRSSEDKLRCRSKRATSMEVRDYWFTNFGEPRIYRFEEK
jgi:hypothetical protein